MDYEKINTCPLCDCGHFHNFTIAKDYLISNESFAIVECDECTFRFTNPRPSKDEIGKYYQSESYVSHSNKSNSLVNLAYKFVRNITLRSKLKLVSKYAKEKSILDFGCGTGHFLKVCEDHGWSAWGAEPDDKARSFAAKQGVFEVASHISELPEKVKFNIITLWHVLEHIHDLNGTIIELIKRLKKKGTLFIALPNSDSWDAGEYDAGWAGYDVPRHLYHFVPETFKKLMAKHNLKVKTIIPQKWDAYYVSLLSEKYLYNTNNYLKALKNGYKSNNYALKNNSYSSLIYVVTR